MYTLNINTDKEKFEAIIHFLKAFDIDFSLVSENIESEQITELKKRLTYSKKNPNEGFTWEEIEKSWENDEKV